MVETRLLKCYTFVLPQKMLLMRGCLETCQSELFAIKKLFFFFYLLQTMIGPAIPEALLKKKQNEAEIAIPFSDDEEEDLQSTAGPQIPAHLLEKKRQNNDNTESIGPQIPQHILQQKTPTSNANSDEIAISDEDDEGDEVAGPQIPQHILDQKKASLPPKAIEEVENPIDFAPALPPDLLEQRQNQKQPSPPQQKQQTGGRRRRPVGPSFPTGPMPPSNDEDEFIVGPALPKNYNPEEEAKYSAIQAIEERARSTKEAMEQVKRRSGIHILENY